MTSSAATTAEHALCADLDRIAVLEGQIRAAQAEQLRLIDRSHGYARAVAEIHDGSPQVEREFATRSFIAELSTLLRIPEATASGLIADAGIARRHPDTSPRSRPGRSASLIPGPCSMPSSGSPRTMPPGSRPPHSSALRGRPRPRSVAESESSATDSIPNR